MTNSVIDSLNTSIKDLDVLATYYLKEFLDFILINKHLDSTAYTVTTEIQLDDFYTFQHLDTDLVEHMTSTILQEYLHGTVTAIEKEVNYEKGNIVFTKKVKEPCNINNHDIDWKNIPEELIGNEIPVRAGIGCPFTCAFCDFADLHEKLVLRKIDGIMAELTRIQTAFPGKSIFFTDDNLFISKSRTRNFLKAIINSGLKFKWRAFFRVDSVDDEIAKLAAKAGCRMALLGVESGDEKILKNMNKRITSEQILTCVRKLNDNGISSISTIIVGFPGETEISVSKTIKLLNSYPKEQKSLMIYYPFVFSLTPLSRASLPVSRNKFNSEGLWFNWKHKTMDVKRAQEELIRLTKEVKIPILQYPENVVNGIGPAISVQLMRVREDLARSGISVLNETNVKQVYNRFKQILTPEIKHKYNVVYRATA